MARDATQTTVITEGLLERSEQLAALADAYDATLSERRGRLVLLAGEAGIGKTTLLRAFAAEHPQARILAGACDALHTPRPLGPFADIAEQAGGDLAMLVAEQATPAQVVHALASAIQAGANRLAATVLVLEDLHWADTATLDVLRLLARRLDDLPVLVVATYRDDELDRTHPLRVALGELPRERATRIALPALSPAAVAALVGDTDAYDCRDLHERTSGNPFFVTEILAACDGTVPATVRDAVLARAARLDPGAQNVLDAVAVVPRGAELWLLEAITGNDLDGLDAGIASGMLRAERATIAFRHEIARVAIEESLAPHVRAQLHARALHALASPRHGHPDPARLAHHAEAADDGAAVLTHAPAAGERAARLGSHKEAADQFERALRYADAVDPTTRADLLERLSYETYLVSCIGDAIDARRLALAEHERARDTRRQGDAHRWLSRLAWYSGDNADAMREGALAVQLLEAHPPGRELAMAYSNLAQLRMLASDLPGATQWGTKAIALAEELDETETLVHALNNVGSAELVRGDAAGREKLERSLALALDAGLDEHVARAFTNLGSITAEARDLTAAEAYLTAGIAYCTERDLDAWGIYMTGYRARVELDRGRLDDARRSAESVLEHPGVTAPVRIPPLVVLGRIAARTGADPWPVLDEAKELATRTGELQRLSAVAIARAEARWLAGEPERIDAETADVLAEGIACDHDRWVVGELALWRRRAGLRDDDLPTPDATTPFHLELADRHAEAARLWASIGCRYEAALARAHASDEDEQRGALEELLALGATPAAQRVARTLRERGVRGLRHGPRAKTRANPAGMTARELEVLAHVAEGLRNADIAARLFLSEKTVAHHVSAILRKLDVPSRGQAGMVAARLGLVER